VERPVHPFHSPRVRQHVKAAKHLAAYLLAVTAELEEGRREIERLRGLLRNLEWRGPTLLEQGVCPACDASPDEGHQADCWLAAEIIRSTSGEERP
jgi:hypothetical protein